MRISVLGAGGWGTTLAIVLYLNGHHVTLWEYRKDYAKALHKTRYNKTYLPGVLIPEPIKVTHSLHEAIENKHMIIIAVPTQFIRGVMEQVRKINYGDATFVSVSKGVEKGSLFTVTQIIKDELEGLDESNIGVLSGPSHAEEVSRKIPTAVVAASSDPNTTDQIQAAFMTSYFRVYSSDDVLGVELGGALKNVMAIGAGMVEGAGFGDNTKALIMTRGIAEISRLGVALGAKKETFSGLSGMGDLVVTCMSKHSRNRFVGEQIGKGLSLEQVMKNMKMVAEGVETCRGVVALAEEADVETPIVDAVFRVLYENHDPVKATYELLTRDIEMEH